MGNQKIKVVAVTKELENLGQDEYEKQVDELNKAMTVFSGKMAGICYMPDDYLDMKIQNEEAALKRALNNSKSGHHSVYDHAHVSMVIKTNKMMAMILNSLGVYVSSEKSARYTKMHPETELETNLYDKWKDKIKELILKEYPDIDDSDLNKAWIKEHEADSDERHKWFSIVNRQLVLNDHENENISIEMLQRYKDDYSELLKSKDKSVQSTKLGMENARYMISVFTPTVLGYTVSFRQLFLIIDYLEVLEKDLKLCDDTFSRKLIKHVVELRDEFNRVAGDKRIKDNKNQYIRFLTHQHMGFTMKTGEYRQYSSVILKSLHESSKKDYFGDCYTTTYFASLSCVAQTQRHRTLRHEITISEPGEYGYYVPEIIKSNSLEDEWLKDIKSVEYAIPQGTLVKITEQGIFEDFALKCKERLCGRAQLETMRHTEETLKKFMDNRSNLCNANIVLLDNMIKMDKDNVNLLPCPRCQFNDFRCTEGCYWSGKRALTRNI